MEKPIKVSIVSYINSLPFLYGLRHSGLAPHLELSLDVPSECARKVRRGEVNLGLMPVAELPQVPHGRVVGGHCIGANGAVETVCLYSHVPLAEINTVLLDSESRTSARLVQLLAREHWQIAPKWQRANPGFEREIEGTTAGLVIGDRAFALNGHFAYTFDLAEEWLKHTGLPFVFAAWVANIRLPSDFETAFDAALQWGVEHRNQAVAQLLPAGIDPAPKVNYVNHRISYTLDAAKQQAMQRFLAWQP